VIDRDFVVATVVPPTKIEGGRRDQRRPAAPSAAAAPAKGGNQGTGQGRQPMKG